MISKKEIYNGVDLEAYSQIIDILKANDLKYKTKVVANDGAESLIFSFMFGSSRRARELPTFMKKELVKI